MITLCFYHEAVVKQDHYMTRLLNNALISARHCFVTDRCCRIYRSMETHISRWIVFVDECTFLQMLHVH
jgi:hypothetical protein